MAFVIWCWDDPVVSLNGETVSIEVGVRGAPEMVREHVQVAETTIILPDGVDAHTITTTNEFFEETVKFLVEPAATEATIEVRFEATKDLPVAIRVNGWIAAEGTTMGTLTTTVPVAQYA